MSSTSFGGTNSGTQVVTNHGVMIHFSSDRPGTPQQRTDHEVLRSLAFPQMLDRRDNIERCHTNTCQWILDLEKYKSWRQSRGLLWIKGKPGAGKSTLMAFLHDKVEKLHDGSQGIWLDFFFTARGTEMQRTPLGMFRTLLNQIFDRDVTVRPRVRETYERRCMQFGYGERQWEWPQGVLEELLISAILDSANQQPVTIFVDALDEAGAESAQWLAAYFHRLIDRAQRKALPLQICISCRHYPILENARAIEIYVEEHNHEDIATYIKDILADSGVGDGLGQEMRDRLVEQLIQQANGVFQWAYLMVPLIRRRMLEGESFDDTCYWLRDIPSALEDIYIYVLKNTIEDRNHGESLLLFQWICLAERPLTVTEMRYALAANKARMTSSPIRTWENINGFIESDERMKRRIKALSGGLAEIVLSGDGKETVQAVHQSVNDFLRVKGLQLLYRAVTASRSSFDDNKVLFQCQAALYRSCLVYLATANLPQDCSRERREEIIQEHPLLNYATINLFIHAENAAESRQDVVQNEFNVLQEVISRWVQIYRILHRSYIRCPAKGTTLLHMSAAANLVDVMERLLSNSTNIAMKNEDGSTAFHSAAQWGHIPAGKILLEKGGNCERRNRNGMTPLREAARWGRVKFVEWLLYEGANIGNLNDVGSALQDASEAGHESVVELIIGAGAEVNAQGGMYGNALQAAAYEGRTKIVQMLLDAHADVNAQGGRYGNALQAAAYRGDAEIVQMLLDAHADVNAQGGEYGNSLQAAAFGGRTKIVQMLLDAHADVNAQGGEYGNSLQAAAFGGDAEIVQMLLDAHADVNAQGGEYGNALQAAASAYRGRTKIVQMLLDAHADVNAQGGEYGNALQAAAYRGHAGIVQMLLDAPADVNAQSGEYGNALQAAAFGGDAEIVQMLLDAHADVNAQGGSYGNALQAAAYGGYTKIVQMLLDAPADVNAQGGRYGNALQAAAYGGRTKIVQMLLDAHADVNAQGGEYGNALQAAAFGGDAEIVQMLLDAHADVNAQGGMYGNALQAAAYGGYTKIVQMLLDAHADVNAQGGEYGNALQAAAYRGRTKIVQMLLDAHADVNAQGGEYGNSLQAAAFGGDTEIVQMLLDAHADVNAQGGEYGNALQAAAFGGDAEIVQMLLDAHADVNAQGGEYGNALHAAVVSIYGEHPETVQMLLDAHADVNAQGGEYGNALQAAAYRRHTKIVQMLLDAHADVNAQGGEYGNALQAAAFGGDAEIVQMLLDAHADVNAQGGEYGSPLLAAAYGGHIGQVQVLLNVGADFLFVDELGQTLLHAAASRNMLQFFYRFPLLTSNINIRDKLLQTPLHLAIYLGHIRFAFMLLDLGADPCIQDGFGRNILDWALGNPSLIQQILNKCPHIVLTPDKTQNLTVSQSILHTSDMLLRSKLNSPWPLLQQLGRYFLFLNDVDNARYLFQLHLSGEAFGTTVYQIICDLCERRITGSHFIYTNTMADYTRLKKIKPLKCPVNLQMSVDSLGQHQST
ncbi:hypothetical protein N7495_006559 [Penicillium taxi]|uniref:uncharacterized protein n=1 Tax=Penicillium taxi TaxID=168475 RepID=UPI0025456CEE|nr:uncharacterized protein N7495_006559 [Penicillium taxi]KAJ5894868.1 hypothetical protein N7495_006559 [Penicillium taxi]